MDRKINELREITREFAVMQREHGEALAAGKGVRAALWTARRACLQARLRDCLDSLMAIDGDVSGDSERSAMIQQSISAIMAGEERLAAAVSRRRRDLGKQLRMMRRGKKALKGYGSAPGAPPNPRYVSSRM